MNIGQRLGEGNTAAVFEWGKNEVIKIFHEHHQASSEADKAEIINRLGIPAPRLTNVIEHNGKTALIFERVYGQTMLSLIEPTSKSIVYYAGIMANLQLDIHCIELEPELESNLKQELIHKLNRTERLTGTQKEEIMKTINQLSNGQSLCHYDFHPGNIMMSSDGPVIIDWTNALIGHHYADVARSSMMLKSNAMPPEAPVWTKNRTYRDMFHDAYLKEYLNGGGTKHEELERWASPTLAARIEELAGKEQEEILNLLVEKLNAAGGAEAEK